MKNFINTLLVSACILGPIALIQAQNEIDTRYLGPYHSVKVSGSYKINLVKGQPGSITLEGSKLSAISTSTKNGTLIIQSKPNIKWNNWRNATIITVPIDEVRALSLSGSGTISNKHTLESDQLKIALAGSGKIDLNVDADAIESSVSGSGGISITGFANQVNFSLAGSGTIKASELKADSAFANISGSGSVQLYASNSFNGNISGSGKIKCYGSPEKQNQKVLGSGRVSFVN